MFTSRLFWKIFAVYAVLTLISAAVLVTILSARQRDVVVELVEERLHSTAVMFKDDMKHVFQEPKDEKLQEKVRNLGKTTGIRLTLVDEAGIVWADSEEDPEMMDNHKNRDELLQARSKEYGVTQRYSSTLSKQMMYVALRIGDQKTPDGFVRVATPMELVKTQVLSVQQVIWVTVVIVSLLAIFVTYFVVGRMIRPLATLTEAAKSIASGEIEQEVEVDSKDEIGTLAESFNFMSNELAHRISELDRTGTEFAENSERLEAVLGGMREGVLAVDGNETLLFANRAALELFEFGDTDAIGSPLWESVRSPIIHEVVENALANKPSKRVEIEFARTQSTVEITATRLAGEPCPGLILVLHDVTELRRLENVRQQFVSNVSHELKTPLTSIQAYTETLLEGAIDEPEHNRKFLTRISDQADRLHQLIQDLLRLARVEAREDAFVLTEVPVKKVVDYCVSQHTALAEQKRVAIVVQDPPQEVSVYADAEGFRTILDNLVKNAIIYTPEAGDVEIKWVAQDAKVILEVSDTGVGISEEHLPRIFERFYRVDKARSRELGGTGLGLSIVKHLVNEFNGTVEVTSSIGKGTSFLVSLPQG